MVRLAAGPGGAEVGDGSTQYRPTVSVHYDSFVLKRPLNTPERIVLIDDIVTKGRTLLAAASRVPVLADSGVCAGANNGVDPQRATFIGSLQGGNQMDGGQCATQPLTFTRSFPGRGDFLIKKVDVLAF